MLPFKLTIDCITRLNAWKLVLQQIDDVTKKILEQPGDLNNIWFYEEIDMVILHVEANTPGLKTELNNILCCEGFNQNFKQMCSQDPKIVFSTVF